MNPPPDYGRCRACQAKIRWVTTAARRRPMPLDAEPSDTGNVVLDEDGRAVVLSGPAAARIREHVHTFMPHHATCPNRDEYRQRRLEQDGD